MAVLILGYALLKVATTYLRLFFTTCLEHQQAKKRHFMYSLVGPKGGLGNCFQLKQQSSCAIFFVASKKKKLLWPEFPQQSYSYSQTFEQIVVLVNFCYFTSCQFVEPNVMLFQISDTRQSAYIFSRILLQEMPFLITYTMSYYSVNKYGFCSFSSGNHRFY